MNATSKAAVQPNSPPKLCVYDNRYAYYLVSSLGVRCPTPIKKSITLLQMVQFGLLNAQV